MLKTFTAPDYRGLQRRRINANPAKALAVFEQMREEAFGFVPTVQELANRLVASSLEERAKA